jgi:hypothetical protein
MFQVDEAHLLNRDPIPREMQLQFQLTFLNPFFEMGMKRI